MLAGFLTKDSSLALRYNFLRSTFVTLYCVRIYLFLQ